MFDRILSGLLHTVVIVLLYYLSPMWALFALAFLVGVYREDSAQTTQSFNRVRRGDDV